MALVAFSSNLWFPPYSSKALWSPDCEQFGNAPGEHSTALVSVFFSGFFGVGTIWGKGGIPKVVTLGERD